MDGKWFREKVTRRQQRGTRREISRRQLRGTRREKSSPEVAERNPEGEKSHRLIIRGTPYSLTFFELF